MEQHRVEGKIGTDDLCPVGRHNSILAMYLASVRLGELCSSTTALITSALTDEAVYSTWKAERDRFNYT